MKKKFYIYRYFDDMGILLYVGQSTNVLERVSGHRNSSSWFDDATMMTIERCKNRKDMDKREIEAISNERPLYNRSHNEQFALKVQFKPKKAKEKQILCAKCMASAASPLDEERSQEGTNGLPEYNYREEIAIRIADDLKSGKLKSLTFSGAKDYGLSNNMDIRWAQRTLLAKGLLCKKGLRYLSAKEAA